MKIYTLTPDQVRSHNCIKVFWNSISEVELDLFAILLDKNDKLIEDGDFVFYNSVSRTLPFDPEKWHSKANWRNSTLPMSVDGSVYAIGEPMDDDNDGYWGEGMFIDLFRTRPEIHKIIFLLAVYDDGRALKLNDIKHIKVSLGQDGFSEPLVSYKISDSFEDEKVISVCSLQKQSDNNWIVGKEVLIYNDISTLLDKIIADKG